LQCRAGRAAEVRRIASRNRCIPDSLMKRHIGRLNRGWRACGLDRSLARRFGALDGGKKDGSHVAQKTPGTMNAIGDKFAHLR